MVKTLILAKDLELTALQEIRAFPGAKYVVSVHLEHAGVTWTLVVSAREGADLDRIHYAVRTTEERLKHRYKLRHDPGPSQ
ncbi:hypothetical protein H8A95_03920 [Bradyrhizobium sp. Pear76]|nr:hypothetical protein [Bradyrhizobium oropedii]